MARGTDAPISAGGQIDPYVQSSLAQSKAQSGNRLISAMQQGAASQRQKTAGKQATAARGEEQVANLQQQAAEMEQRDKQAAAAERGSRLDRDHNLRLQEESQAFATRQGELRRDAELADRAHDEKRSDKLRRELKASEDLEDLKYRQEARNNLNSMMTMMKGMSQQETAREKTKSALVESNEKFEKDSQVFDDLVTNTAQSIKDDTRMDLPIEGKFKDKAILAGAPMGFTSGFTTTKVRVPGTQVNPVAVMQTQLERNRIPFSAEVLAPGNIHELEGMIKADTVTAVDLRNTIGVLDAMVVDVTIREDSAEKGEAKSYWKGQRIAFQDMKRSIIDLRRVKKPIANNQNETVGKRVVSALEPTDPLYSPSVGAWTRELKEQNGVNYDSWIDAMSQAIEPLGELDIDPEADPEHTAEWERYNAGVRAFQQSHPDFLPAGGRGSETEEYQ